MAIEFPSESMFSGDPRKIDRKKRNQEVERLLDELDFPFVKELAYAFLNSTDPESWVVGEMGILGEVGNYDVLSSMRLYKKYDDFHLDIYNKSIEQVKEEGLLGCAGDWDNGRFHPDLEIIAGSQDAGGWFSGKGQGKRYGVSLKFDSKYGNGTRFPDSFNVWLLGFAYELGQEYTRQYSGHYTDQPVFYPRHEKNGELELFQKTRQIYGVKKRNSN